MTIAGATSSSYPERLATFDGYWSGYEATARLLAATGHVYDRPPLEALEEGSRCVSCSLFVKREQSIQALQGPFSGAVGSAEDRFIFHHPNCIRIQIRIPMVTQDLSGYRIRDLCRRFERSSVGSTPTAESSPKCRQQSLLFILPTELRLEIYAMILPSLDRTTEIVTLNRDSSRIVTKSGYEKTGRRDLTKTSILMTCHEVYKDAVDMLFNRITFKFASTKILYLFLRHIGQRGRQLLKSVDIECGMREDAIAFALLASCPKLTAITIRLPRPRILFPRAPIWCVDGMACLLDLCGLQAVSFGLCISGHGMSDQNEDAAILRRELMRPRGEMGSLRWVDGYLDV